MFNRVGQSHDQPMKKPTAWQKFWALFTVVFLATALAVAAELWPIHDPGVVADLRAPECSEWRNLPAGSILRVTPEMENQCKSLRTLLYRKRISLPNEAAYDAYLTRQGFRNAGIALGIWAVMVVGVYLLGWSSNRLVGAVRHKMDREPDPPGAT